MKRWTAYLLLMLLGISALVARDAETEALLDSASVLIDREDTDAAKKIYQALLKSNDQDLRLSGYTGLIHVARFHSLYKTADSLVALADRLSEAHKQAITLSTRLTYLQKKAEVDRHMSRFEEALQTHQYVLDQSAGLVPPDKELTALAYIYIAATYEDMTDHQAALEFGEQGYRLCGEIYEPDDMKMVTPNSIMAVVYMRLNYFDSSFVYYDRAIDILNEKVDEPGAQLALLYGNLGATYNEYGDYEKGMENLEHARALNTKLGELEGLGYNLYGLGTTYYFLGDYGRARDYMRACLAIRKKVYPKGHHLLTSPKEVIGIAEYESGNYEEGLSLMIEVLESRIETYGKHSLPVAYTTENIALSFYDVGLADTALGYMQEAHKVYKEFIPEGTTHFAHFYYNQAKIYLANDLPEPALLSIDKSIDTYKKTGSANEHYIAQNYVIKAEIQTEMGLFDQAEKSYEEAFLTFGGHPLKIASSEELITDVATLDALNSYLEFQYGQKDRLSSEGLAAVVGKISELIFEVADKLRRQYNDPYTKGILMRKGHANNRMGIGLNFDLHKRSGDEHFVHYLFRFAEFGRANLFRDMIDDYKVKSFAGIPDSLLERERTLKQDLASYNIALAEDPKDAEARKKVFETKEAYHEFIELLNTQHPKYHDLKYKSSVVRLNVVQESFLKPRETILEFVQDDTSYYLLVITSEEVQVLYGGNRKNIDQIVAEWQQSMITLNLKHTMELGKALYQYLFEPAEELIAGENVIIIPTGSLFNLSFEALNTKQDVSSCLIYQYNISYALSVNTLYEQVLNGNGSGGQPVIVAPGFEPDLKDQYLDMLSLDEAVDSSYLLALRQPWSKKLAGTLAQKFNGKALVGQDANESSVRSTISHGGVLHFATHAVADHIDPLRSKFILAKGSGEAENDGYLHAFEIYDLSLRSELAILTACESGAGAQQEGEGMISLAYSINYAGCPSVIMSLWKIDEKVNNLIIKDFYNILKTGADKSSALRKAKLNYLSSADGALLHPFYWSGLVVMGDPGSVQMRGSHNRTFYWLLAFVVIFGVLITAGRFFLR